MLTHLPAEFGALRLRSLKLSYNRLETLRHDVFRPALKGTLRQLWLSNNNLLQLPDSLIEARDWYVVGFPYLLAGMYNGVKHIGVRALGERIR